MPRDDMNSVVSNLLKKFFYEISQRCEVCLGHAQNGRPTDLIGCFEDITPTGLFDKYKQICVMPLENFKAFLFEGEEIKSFFKEKDVNEKTKLFADIQQRIKSIIVASNPYPKIKALSFNPSTEISSAEREYLNFGHYYILEIARLDVEHAEYLARQRARETLLSKLGLAISPILMFGTAYLSSRHQNNKSLTADLLNVIKVPVMIGGVFTMMRCTDRLSDLPQCMQRNERWDALRYSRL